MAGVFDLLERFYGGKARSIVKLRAFVDWLGQQVPDDLSDPWAHVLHRPEVSIAFDDDLGGCNALIERRPGPLFRVLLPNEPRQGCDLSMTELLAHELGHADLNLFPRPEDWRTRPLRAEAGRAVA